MIRLSRLSVRRPVAALAAWLLVAAVLGVIGSGVSDQLSPSTLTVAGSESSRAQSLAEKRFGPSVLVPILLQGDQRQLDRQGPELVRRLSARADTRVMSAWDAGETGRALRPDRRSAMIVAAVAHSERDMVDKYQAEIDRTVNFALSGDIHWHITGQPTLDIALKEAAVDTTRRAELLAIPILFALLLVLLQRPLAAAMVAAFGAGTVVTSFGLLTLLAKVVDIDAVAIALGSMSGLALGVGYALLILRRFLDEEAPRPDGRGEAAMAATAAVATAGRSVLFGGTALAACLVLATLVGPTENLTSVGIGVLVCSLIAVGAAVVVMPALLVLLGHKVDAGRFALPAPLVRGWDRLVGEEAIVTRHAVMSGALATAVLLALALPLASIDTGPPDVTQLPADARARQDFEAVTAAMGPGWPTPFNIVVASETRPITDAALLAQIDRFQARIARDRRVASVVGPGAIRAQTKALGKLPASLRSSSKLLKNGKRDLGRLEGGLGQAGAGARELRAGLIAAASGATQLRTGSGAAGSGAGKLRAGIGAARSGAAKIAAGLDQALTGANALRKGSADALAGSQKLTAGLGQAAGPVQQGAPLVGQMASRLERAQSALGALGGRAGGATQSLDQALGSLQSISGGGPEVAAALSAVQTARDDAAAVSGGLAAVQSDVSSASGVATAFAGQTSQLATGLRQLLTGATQLQGGIAQLRAGNARLAGGIAALSTGGGQLTSGLTALNTGAGALEAGLGQLTSGTGQLAGGLSAGVGPTGQLVGGLGQLESGVTKFRGQLPSPKDLEQLQRQSPGLFDSGYFVLAAVAGAPAAAREQASFAVNLGRGGDAGQIVVIPKQAPNTQATRELAVHLRDEAARFATASRTDAAVGGPAGNLTDFNDETAARIWPVVAALALMVAVMMMIMLRTVVLPLVAVAFDLLAAAAAFGILKLLFGGDDPLLGGPGYLDPMSVIGIFAAVFGVSMVYEVLLLNRTREEFVRTGDAHGALRVGLRETAGAATGSAAAMVAAVLPFLFTGLITVRQFGVGLVAVIVIDAVIVRPVLLPAAVELLGRRSWWPTRGAPAPAAPPAPEPLRRGDLGVPTAAGGA